MRLDPDLLAELDAGWEREWPLTPWHRTRTKQPRVERRKRTVSEIIGQPVRDAFVTSDRPTAIVLGCGEGWLLHELLRYGADLVHGVEPDPASRRRARLLGHHFCLSEELVLSATIGQAVAQAFDVAYLSRGTPIGSLETFAERPRLVLVETGEGETEQRAQQLRPLGPVELLEPPTEADPAYITGELAILCSGRIR